MLPYKVLNLLWNRFSNCTGPYRSVTCSKWSDWKCQTVAFPPYRFYPDKQVHVQITVNHLKLNDSVTVHDAVTSWTVSTQKTSPSVSCKPGGKKKVRIRLLPLTGQLIKEYHPKDLRERLSCRIGGQLRRCNFSYGERLIIDGSLHGEC